MSLKWAIVLLFVTVYVRCSASKNVQKEGPGKYFMTTTLEDGSLKSLDKYINGLIQTTRNYVVNPKLVSPQCYEDILYLKDVHGENHTSYSSTPNWQKHILDSGGKLPAGLAEGNVFWMGDFTQCTKVEVWKNTNQPVTRKPDFKGKYCIHSFNHYSSPMDAIQADSVALTSGVCLPSSCTSKDVETLLSEYTYPLKAGVQDHLCQTNEKPEPDTITKLAFVPFIAIAILIFLGTMLETIPLIYNRMNGKKSTQNTEDVKSKGPLKILLLSFSAYNNTRKLFGTESRNEPLSCINGIRSISMMLVVTCHMMLLMLMVSIGRHNPIIFGMIMPKWWAQPFLYATYTVDTFFCLTGFLVTHVLMENAIRIGQFNALAFYAHRLWRITPTFLLLSIFATGPYQTLGDGPLWNITPYFNVTTCRNTLWRGPLYIDVYFNMLNPITCFPHTWYLSVEMFLYLMCPIVLYPMIKQHWSGPVMWVVSFVVACSATGYIAHVNKAENIFSFHVLGIHVLKFFNNLYTKPWGRCQPFLVGIFFGYMYYYYGKNLKISKKWVVLAWIVIGVTMLSCIYGNYPYARHYTDEGPSRFAQDMYLTFSSAAWAFGVGGVIFACATGYGGYVNDILSWKFFVPIGRLSFCAYIVHLEVLSHFGATRKNVLYTDLYLMYIGAISIMACTLFFAYLLCLMVEAPTIQLETLLIKKIMLRLEDEKKKKDMLKEIKYSPVLTEEILIEQKI